MRLLFVCAADDDVTRVQARLSESGREAHVARVNRMSALRTALDSEAWDAMLFRSPSRGLSALSALKLAQGPALDLPFIIIADDPDDPSVRQAMRAGANDCFANDSLERLSSGIEREVRHARHRVGHHTALKMLRESEACFRALALNLPGMVFRLQREPDGVLKFAYVSEGCDALSGLGQQELLGAPRRFFEAIESADRDVLERAIDESAATLGALNWEGRIRRCRQTRWINLRAVPERGDSGAVVWQGIATDITRSKEAEIQWCRSCQQLSELWSYLEEAKEEERERIACDIQDEIGSMLAAIRIEMALLGAKLSTESPGLREKAQAIDEMITSAMDSAGRVGRELRPGILKEFGLPAAIECQAEDFSQRTGIGCRVRCEDDDIAIDEKVALALFRILQEALTNIDRHAHASRVVIDLRREGHEVVMEVRDDGRGISEVDRDKPGAFGLRGIQGRINSLDGEFSIGSVEKGGCRLALRVPAICKAEEESPQGNLF